VVAKTQKFLGISCEIPQLEKQRPNNSLGGELFRPSLGFVSRTGGRVLGQEACRARAIGRA
jgi:hypothetical protein